MSSRKRPLSELHNTRTPSRPRSVPATPHTLRALQLQHSGARTRTVRRKQSLGNIVQPDSHRGVLRRLARLTAPASNKIVPTPDTTRRGKENVTPDEEDEDGGLLSKRPRLMLEIEDSIDSSGLPDVGEYEEEEDSDLPAEPTLSVLPNDDSEHSAIHSENPTFTLKSISWGNEQQPVGPDRSTLSRSPAADPTNHHDEEDTILSERGRRAVTIDPTENLSRFDFGPILLDNIPSPQQVRQDDTTNADKEQIGLPVVDHDYIPFNADIEETEALGDLQRHRSLSLTPGNENHVEDIPSFDVSGFQLPEPVEATSTHARTRSTDQVADTSLLTPTAEADFGWEDDDEGSAEAAHEAESGDEADAAVKSSSHKKSTHSVLPAEPAPQSRRKRLKQTGYGEMIPALPASVIRREAVQAQERLGNRPPKLGKDHMRALEQATEWFFEQVGEDLAAFSDHARRKKRVVLSDALLVLQRQRRYPGKQEFLKKAKELLPKDAFEDLKADAVFED